MSQVITIGSATMDVFVECDDAGVLSVRLKDRSADYMSYPYGAKMEITKFATQVGGGGVNTAVNFDNLGYDTCAIFKVGDDIYSKGLFDFFKTKGVKLNSVIRDVKDTTGFSIILVSFEGDRTVLAHRGANAHIKKSEIDFEAIKNAKLLYIAPLNGESNRVLDDIVKFAKENDTWVCFNAGSTGIKKGFNYLKKILELAENMIKLSGVEGIEIVETGLRPGEKLYEELLVSSADLRRTENEKIFIEQDEAIDCQLLQSKLDALRKACQFGDDTVRDALHQIVPTYKTPAEVNDLVN